MFGPWRLGLAKDQAGSLSTVTALLMPALMAAAGLGADTLHWTWQQQIMQRQAESAALTGAEALSQNRAVAETVQAQLASGGQPALAIAPIIEQGPSSGPFAGDPLVVRVRLSSIARLPFAGLFSSAGVPIVSRPRPAWWKSAWPAWSIAMAASQTTTMAATPWDEGADLAADMIFCGPCPSRCQNQTLSPMSIPGPLGNAPESGIAG